MCVFFFEKDQLYGMMQAKDIHLVSQKNYLAPYGHSFGFDTSVQQTKKGKASLEKFRLPIALSPGVPPT